jgi:histidyl-tRNA synthetase
MTSTNTAKGTRDFAGVDLWKRNYLFGEIKAVFLKYGFEPLETPAMENIETLTGKYGEEGDQLLFRVLRSGDFLQGLDDAGLRKEKLRTIRQAIVDKGLRYDLTIPFARFVARYHAELPMPYKRYQIQPVWRADRPAKGRYREFYQCDADVAGSTSLLLDSEFIPMVDEVFGRLSLPPSIFKINNRKILAGMGESLSGQYSLESLTASIDKLDKIGMEGVRSELINRGFSNDDVERIGQFMAIDGNNAEKMHRLAQMLPSGSLGQTGLVELNEVLSYLSNCPLDNTQVQVDFSLARGLNYYTGTIYEVVLKGIDMGSVASGGRYDNLTEGFGVKNLPGVGLSFGAERLYDVMENLGLFPQGVGRHCQVLVINLDEKLNPVYLGLVQSLRKQGVATEIYPAKVKIGKQMKYAEKKGIPYALIAGEPEFEQGKYQLKNLETGHQEAFDLPTLIQHLTV